jgi:hypothetical protein
MHNVVHRILETILDDLQSCHSLVGQRHGSRFSDVLKYTVNGQTKHVLHKGAVSDTANIC